jgi:hypothetical protein
LTYSSRGSTEPNFDIDEMVGRVCFMVASPQNDNGGETRSPLTTKKSISASVRRASSPERPPSDSRRRSLTPSSVDWVYDDIEQKCLEAEKPWARKVYDLLVESSDEAQYFLNRRQNMVAIAMMIRSILEPDELKAKVIY